MPSVFENIVCPDCNKQVIFNQQSGCLHCSTCNQKFVIKDSVPIMLVQNAENTIKNTELHGFYGTNFNYVSHYQIDAEQYDYFEVHTGATAHSEQRVHEYIISKISGNTKTILDVGSGSAWVAEYFCKRGVTVVSLDISLKNTSKALQKFPFNNHYAIVADAYHLPFSVDTFDAVIASEIIEHVADPEKFANSLFHVLKSKGNLIITTPYKEKLIYSLCIHCNRLTPQSAHIHTFDEMKLLSLIPDSKFSSLIYNKFNNKVLLHLRTHIFLKYFGFSFWKIIDKLFNTLFSSPSRILIKWTKV